MTQDTRAGLQILSFPSAAEFEAWLAAQPRDHAGIWLKLSKKGSSTQSLAKHEAIDAALCHGWIDGQLAKCDEASWLIRFTPRRARSKWSDVNRSRALQLMDQGRMAPGGIAEVERAKSDGRWDAAYAPQSRAEVPSDLQTALDQSPAAAQFFATLTGTNRYAILYRIADAKRPDTRARRIQQYVELLERGRTLH